MRVARVVAISRARVYVSLPSRVRGVYNARRDICRKTRARIKIFLACLCSLCVPRHAHEKRECMNR